MAPNSTDTLETLAQRLTALEKQVKLLEKFLPDPNAAFAKSQPTVKPTPDSTATQTKQQGVTQRVSQVQTPSKAESSSGSAKFLGGVGILCFVLAASYFIKLAIDEGWLTPMRQLAGTWLFGLSLIAAGFRLRQKDLPYASLLPAAGIIVLFMAAYAGHLHFHLYTMGPALVIVNGVAIGCVFLFRQFRENFYALAATIGTYLVPILVKSSIADLHVHSLYYLLWGVTYSLIAVSLRSRLFIGVAAYMAILTFAIFSFEQSSAIRSHIAFNLAVIQAIQFLLFAIAMAWYSIKHRLPLSSTEAWAYFPVLLLFYFTEYALLREFSRSGAPWFSLGFAILVYLIYLAAEEKLKIKPLDSFPMVAAFLSVVVVHALYFTVLPASLSPWFSIATLIVFILCRRLGAQLGNHWVSVLVLGGPVLVEFIRALGVDSKPNLETVILNFAFAALLALAAFGRTENRSGSTTGSGGWLIVLAATQLLFGLKHLSGALFGSEIARFVTSTSWGLVALGLLIAAKAFNDKGFASGALWLFGIVAVKVLLFDLSASGPTAQIVALVVIGVLFYAGGYVYRQIVAPEKAADVAN